jgi:hypothetical protein
MVGLSKSVYGRVLENRKYFSVLLIPIKNRQQRLLTGA